MVATSVLATHESSSFTAISGPTHVFDVSQLEKLVEILTRDGYSVLGPTVRDGAIVYGPIRSIEDLPKGWTDEQSPGKYRLKRREGEALFAYGVGPQSWKKYLHLAEVRLWAAERKNGSFRILNNEAHEERPQAFLGVRACELAAIRIQDRVLLEDRYRDLIYGDRRSQAFIAAVQCTRTGATCFCASMGTGPAVGDGADLILTELVDASGQRFLARAGSERGNAILAELKTTPASNADLDTAQAAVERAAKEQARSIDVENVKELLYQNFEHPRWDSLAARCLTCANCTMVCPTCFCTTVEDSSDVSGMHSERWRRWDSCFTQSFSYIHGGSVRTSGKSRYRQWIMHKLAAWIDQFGTPGCVGCGRCITWCPVGIDITEEVRALREGGNNGNS
ncbi:MAG TPA: 4Fe-4S dicluster domain-containing protein [Candidatus Acidoferrales bacterium]|nr:4Fe-4S dicluster domain-containing protein [Candidatus Acidoferrales bacterium]